MSKLKGSFYGLGPSPIDRLSGGMYKMAKAYDVLGKSISKFNSSINKMNLEKVSQFRMLTANIAVLSALDPATRIAQRIDKFGAMGEVIE